MKWAQGSRIALVGPGTVLLVTHADVLRELDKLARRLGVAVRFETFDVRVIEGKGGLCWIRGNPTVVIDGGAPLLDKIAVLADALRVFDIEALYVPPVLRQRLSAVPRRAAR
jgi:hypothetical protein